MDGGPNGAGCLAIGALLVLGLATGCTSGPAPVPHVIAPKTGEGAASRRVGPPSTAVSPVSYLDDEYEQIYPVRIKLRTLGTVGFDLPLVTEPSPSRTDYQPSDAPELVVIDEQDDVLRVISDESSTRLLLWLRARDVYRVVDRRVRLAPSPTGAAMGDAGVWLMPGVAIDDVNEREGAMVEVRYQDNCVEVEGWLTEDVLARTYQPVAEPEPPDDDKWLSLADGTVYDRPGGRTIATIECPVRRSGADQGGLTPIVYRDGGVMVRGFAAIKPAQGSLFGTGYGGFGGLAVNRRLSVPEGTCIRTEPGGPVVGRFTADDTLYDSGNEPHVIEHDGRGWRVPIATRWGTLRGYLREIGPAPDPAIAGAGQAGDDGEAAGRSGGRWLVSKDLPHGPLEECR